jgi:hypothetical protein
MQIKDNAMDAQEIIAKAKKFKASRPGAINKANKSELELLNIDSVKRISQYPVCKVCEGSGYRDEFHEGYLMAAPCLCLITGNPQDDQAFEGNNRDFIENQLEYVKKITNFANSKAINLPLYDLCVILGVPLLDQSDVEKNIEAGKIHPSTEWPALGVLEDGVDRLRYEMLIDFLLSIFQSYGDFDAYIEHCYA